MSRIAWYASPDEYLPKILKNNDIQNVLDKIMALEHNELMKNVKKMMR